MVIIDVRAEQLTFPSTGTCTVKVTWEYGEVLPDVVQVYVRGHGSTEAPLIVDQQRIEGKRDRDSVEFQLPVGSVWEISVCPRQLEDDKFTLKDKAAYGGVEQYWEGWCLIRHGFVTKASPKSGQGSNTPPVPQIQMRLNPTTWRQRNHTEFMWNPVRSTHYHYISRANHGSAPSRQVRTRETFAVVKDQSPSSPYSFEVQACFKPFNGTSECSQWSRIEYTSAPPLQSMRAYFHGADLSIGLRTLLSNLGPDFQHSLGKALRR